MHKTTAYRIKLQGRIRKIVHPAVAETLYKATILPIFRYISNTYILMSDSQSSKIEKLQHRALKAFYYLGIQIYNSLPMNLENENRF